MTTPTAPANSTLPFPARNASVDFMRGLACALMAIDHVRVYSGLPAGGPTAGIFLTRWVTHFVAPAFCFFAGTGIWYMARKVDTASLRRFLVSRGLILVLLELTLIRFLWAWNVGPDFLLAGVIWMLGWCMVLMAPFVGMPAKRVGWIGVAVIVLQPLFGLAIQVLPASAQAVVAPWWAFLYPSGSGAALGFNVLYVLVPWIGVMMAGFGFGLLLDGDEARRHQRLRRLGLGLTAAFLVIATIVALVTGGDADSDGGGLRALWMRILDQRKYPASPLFLLMTLGPAIALLPWAERATGWWARALVIFGRVPMWYYLMHLAVIHTLSVFVMRWTTGGFHYEWYATAPYAGVEPDAQWPLGLLYVVWAVALAALYPLCRWYEAWKRNNPSAWMKYI